MANSSDIAQSDLAELLTVLGIGDHARPQSPHEVFQEALGVLRERLASPSPSLAVVPEVVRRLDDGSMLAIDRWDVKEMADAVFAIHDTAPRESQIDRAQTAAEKLLAYLADAPPSGRAAEGGETVVSRPIAEALAEFQRRNGYHKPVIEELLTEFGELLLTKIAPTPPASAGDVGAILKAACKPWEHYVGEPPDDGSPLSGVFVAGMVYTERLLAKLLDVTHYEGGDGSEDFDSDATQTLRNILAGAGLWDADENRPTAPAAPEPKIKSE